MEKQEERERFYMANILGSTSTNIIEDLESVSDNFFEEREIANIRAGSVFYFCYSGDIEELNQIFKILCKSSAYVIMDITDNLNVFDFRGYMTKDHNCSEEFMLMVNKFLVQEEKEEILTNEERLRIALANEDYEAAANIRDEINSSIQ